MTDTTSLAARLRKLRLDWGITQNKLSDALGLSATLVSGWENGTAVPPEERLNGYARFFATRRSMEQHAPSLIPAEDLTVDEERRRSALIEELVRLREEALDGPAPRLRETGALGGRFWYFPDGQPITVLCTPLSPAQLGYTAEAAKDGSLPPAVQYSTNPTHPNAVRNLGNGDIDALLELVGHVRAENPTADVRWLTYDRITSVDQLTGHLVVLGSGDVSTGGAVSPVKSLMDSLEIPVRARFLDSDPEFGAEFVLQLDPKGTPTFGGDQEEVFRPRFLRDESTTDRPRLLVDGAPQLNADIALIVRKSNPLNLTAKVTILSGMFSRGTYGAVRAFTDEKFRARNEQWLANANALTPENFWLLVQVSVFAGENTITPDLGRASQRLRISS